MPSREIALETADSTYYHFKTDIFKREMTYSTDKSVPANLVTVSADRVFDIINMNKRGEKPEKLNVEGLEKQKERTEFVDLVGQDSVTRFDKAKKKKKKGTPSQQRGNSQPGQRENNGGNRPPRNDRSSRGDNNRRQNQNAQRNGETGAQHKEDRKSVV